MRHFAAAILTKISIAAIYFTEKKTDRRPLITKGE